jgi:putative transcriptional regulator
MVRLIPPVVGGNTLPLYIGGPVQPEVGWILMNERPVSGEYRTIRDGLYLSSSPEVLRAVLEQEPSPRARVIAGYAGWGPGQLDEELAQSAWLIGDVHIDLVFDVEPPAMWETAIRRLGADPSALQPSHGVH